MDNMNIDPIMIGSDLVKRVESIRNLGLHINQYLSPETHANRVVQNVYATLNRLYHLKHVIPNYIKRNLINCLTLPYFDFCDVAYHIITLTHADIMAHWINYKSPIILAYVLYSI